MKTIIMTVLTIKVGFFGIVSKDYDEEVFENMDLCDAKLEAINEYYSHLPVKRAKHYLKITDKPNYTIYSIQCEERYDE